MKRSEKEIIRDIADAYCNLSPENLTCDGELSPARVARKRRRITNALDCLFRELGREISEVEAYTEVNRGQRSGRITTDRNRCG